MLDLIKIRHRLHELAEISLDEEKTAKYLKEIINKYSPTKLIEDLGAHSFAALFERGTGPTILFRADLDALPIQENISCDYSSLTEGVSHMCGHDGHMTCVLSLLDELENVKGTLILFFQSAEETGAGAKLAIESDFFKSTHIDFVFAYHNLPEKPLGKIYLSPNTFSCASVGLKIDLSGQSSHASEPEKSLSPHDTVKELIDLCQNESSFKENSQFKIMTMTHLNMGEKSFGITPGSAQVYITLRALSEENIEQMKKKTESILKKSKLSYSIEEHDYFPSTVNSEVISLKVEKIFKDESIDYEKMIFPNRWSEDFGHFTKKFQGVYLGIGAGEKTKPLHHPEYDFPDELLFKVKEIFSKILLKIKND